MGQPLGPPSGKLAHYSKEAIDGPSAILSVLVSLNTNGQDVLCWNGSSNGQFSLSSTYVLAANREQVRGIEREKQWRSLWKLKLPHKIKLSLWKCGLKCLPTASFLCGRGMEFGGRQWVGYRKLGII
ncbi:hypothetical protein J1N35_042069 [Gossypium stocksii]|uniref:Reverse transcriptase zinc-binding domain-containing protein n=1 Tax=Gossypium stocksii TaxID=47602 RepID=A0A9D3UGM9_9ROSI|nr:hypothetical protein J1N35_042069 [Gossypium stocksii]